MTASKVYDQMMERVNDTITVLQGLKRQKKMQSSDNQDSTNKASSQSKTHKPSLQNTNSKQ
jgi:hypothetical protein